VIGFSLLYSDMVKMASCIPAISLYIASHSCFQHIQFLAARIIFCENYASILDKYNLPLNHY